jgi:formylglycine-generating enzyme required for sulfatase activity
MRKLRVVVTVLVAAVPALGGQRRPQEPKPREFTNSLGMKFVHIPAGTFQMGGVECAFPGGCRDTQPVHRVRITRAFSMQTTPVTQGQWQTAMGNNPSGQKSCGLDCPVETVSWVDVQEFIQVLNRRSDGGGYRLPTEAEWEYAARAGKRNDYFYAGEFEPYASLQKLTGYPGDLDAKAWYERNSASSTHPVAQKRPNAWGLFDTLGNVREWCQDWYQADYYTQSPEDDPQGPETGQYLASHGGSGGPDTYPQKIQRGCSAYDYGGDCYLHLRGRGWAKVADTVGFSLDGRFIGVGFRLVRDEAPNPK